MADANLNRVSEGLRTLEDIARFEGWGAFQASYKSLRHGLQACMASFPRASMLAVRDADGDVGRLEKQASEQAREQGMQSIAAAAAGRVEQGLRVLEETAKFLAPQSASALEALRYRAYDLNANLQLRLQRDTAFLQRAKLYVLVDCSYPIAVFVQRVRAISEAGAELIQLRDKQAEAKTLMQYTQAALEELDVQRTRWIVNDRVDVAHASGAWGVHVGQEDLGVDRARAILGAQQVVGLSTHDVDQVAMALQSGADYIGCGPTFPSSTKRFDQFAGLAFLREAARTLMENATDLPAYAIGGIHSGNVEAVLEAGFRRVAVSSAVWRAEHPGREAAALRQALDRVG